MFPGGDESGRARRRWIWILAALAVVVLALPRLATPYVRGVIVERIERDLDARASVAELSFGWSGKWHVGGLVVETGDGRTIGSVRRLDGRVDLPRAMVGDLDVDVSLEDFALHLWKDADGSWNLAGPGARDGPDSRDGDGTGAGGRTPEGPREPLPELRARLAAKGGQLVFHGSEGTTTLSLELAADLESWDEPAPFELAVDVTGPDGPGGRLRLAGQAALADRGRAGAPGASGRLSIELTALRAAALAPVLALVAPVQGGGAGEGVEGELNGRVELALERGLALTGDVELALDGARLHLEQAAEPLTGNLRLDCSLQEAARPGEPIRVQGTARLEELSVVWPVGEEVLRVAEPRIGLDFDAELVPAETPELSGTLALDSRLARGTIRGGVRLATDAATGTTTTTFRQVEGELTYVPDRLAELAGPWLPCELAGAEPERLAFRLDGPTAGFTPEELLAHTTLGAELGVGTLRVEGFTLGGTLALDAQDGRARLDGRLRANGGTLVVEGDLGTTTASDVEPRLRLVADGVQANRELAPLLGRLHPAFAAVEAVKDGSIGGRITSRLELRGAEAPSLFELASGGLAPLVAQLDGNGSFRLDAARLEGSPLMSELLGQLGLDVAKGLDLDAIDFLVEKGRLSYTKPWQWTIEDTKTTFTGSIGLDATLDMAWSIPISEALIDEYGFLSSFAGEVLEVPLGGTLTRPRLELKGVLSGLATKAAAEALGGGGGADGESVDELFRRANALWERGDKLEAAELYRRIREDHKLTLIYALNRDRIKERGKYRPQ